MGTVEMCKGNGKFEILKHFLLLWEQEKCIALHNPHKMELPQKCLYMMNIGHTLFNLRLVFKTNSIRVYSSILFSVSLIANLIRNIFFITSYNNMQICGYFTGYQYMFIRIHKNLLFIFLALPRVNIFHSYNILHRKRLYHEY
jgi:hypothetical protein